MDIALEFLALLLADQIHASFEREIRTEQAQCRRRGDGLHSGSRDARHIGIEACHKRVGINIIHSHRHRAVSEGGIGAESLDGFLRHLVGQRLTHHCHKGKNH